MPDEDEYFADNENMSGLIKDLDVLIKDFHINLDTIEILSFIEKGKIKNFLDLKEGITHEESVKIYGTIFNLKSACERLYFTNK